MVQLVTRLGQKTIKKVKGDRTGHSCRLSLITHRAKSMVYLYFISGDQGGFKVMKKERERWGREGERDRDRQTDIEIHRQRDTER